MAATTRERPRARSRRALLAGLAAFAGLVVVALLALRPWSSAAPTTDQDLPGRDRDVLVTDVAYTPSDTAFTVGSVAALTQGDRAFLRLRLIWRDDGPDEGDEELVVPSFSAEVTHREPYAGMTAVCGLPAPMTVPARSAPESVDLPCKGLLVPESVATVLLRD